MEDLKLIEDLKTGTAPSRAKAQSRLYTKYNKTLVSYINRKFDLADFEVDSIVAITFEKAFRKIDTYNDEFSFVTWLMKIAKNSTIDSFRSKKKINAVSFTNFNSGSDKLEAKDYDPVDPMTSQGFSLSMESDYDMDLINTLLSHLPSDRDRQIMKMKYLEDLTHREVGERLGIAMGTIQSIVNKSIKHLQSIADDYREDRDDNIDNDLINEYYED